MVKRMPRPQTPLNEIHPHFRRLMQLNECETLSELARLHNIQPQRLINIAKRAGNPVLRTHLELAQAFDIPAEDWFRALAE